MTHIGQIIEFSSSQFPVCTEDEELGNPDTMHGYALAKFLADNLGTQGFRATTFTPEDWGWHVEIENPEFPLAFGCNCENRSDDFIVFVEPSKPVIRRWFRKIDVSARTDALNEAIFSLLAKSGKLSAGPSWA